MSVFDQYIGQTKAFVERMREKGRLVRELSSADIPTALSLKVGPGSSPGIVMKSETFLELGSPATGSCAFALSSDRMSILQDGRICLIGPDVSESPEATLSF